MDISESDCRASKPQFPIVCRPNPRLWWIVPVGLLEGIFMLSSVFFPDSSNSPGPNWLAVSICWPFGLFILSVVVAMAFDLAKGEIRADETGLTWRRYFRRGKSVRWDEIMDFYQNYLVEAGSRVVVTPAGNVELSRNYGGIEKIVAIVPQCALAVGKSHWEVKSFRQGQKWPLKLKVWTKDAQWSAPGLTGAMLLLVGIVFSLSQLPSNETAAPVTRSYFEIAMAIFGMLPIVAFFGATCWALTVAWRERNFASGFKDVAMELNPQGFTFTDREKAIVARWHQVLAIEFLDPVNGHIPIEIRTTQGDLVIWWGGNGSGMWPRVRAVLRQYVPDLMAVHDQAARQRFIKFHDLQGQRGAWTGAAVEQGRPRWGFRSSGNRFLGQITSLVAPFIPCLYCLNIYAGPGKGSDVQPEVSWPLFAAMSLTALLILVVGWVWYYCASVVVTEDALEMRFPFGLQRRAAWRDIESQGRDACGDFVKAKGRKMHFTWFVAPVRVEELRDYIEAQIRVHSR